MKISGPIREFHVLHLGAGVQSTTLYLMSMLGEGPRYDCAVFADTQEEPAAVYSHLAWLQSLGGPEIIVRTVGKLGDDLQHGRNTSGGRFAAIPAFTTKDGGATVGITNRQCTKEYKTELIERTIRREVIGLLPRKGIPRDVRLFSYIGISLDEKSRASRIYERFWDRKRWEVRFPLLERMFTRADALDWLATRGNVPHEVPRSACVFCPFHSDKEWLRLKDAGGPDWQRVVQIDRALRDAGSVANRDMQQTMYLHKSCKPIDEVVFRPKDEWAAGVQRGFAVECDGVCGV